MTFNQGLVSVIVASYNHAEFLDQRIQSLLAQDYKNIEIIVIDDASTDQSPKILKTYRNVSNLIVIELGRNTGWISVSNLGARKSKGEYLVFANCDDYADPRQISKLVQALETNPSAGLAFSRSNIVDAAGFTLGNDFDSRGIKFRKTCSRDTLISSRLMTQFLHQSIVIPNLSAAMFRKSVFMEIGLFTGTAKIAGDWELYFRLAEKYDVSYLCEPLNFFRSHEDTIRSQTKVFEMQQDIGMLLVNRMRISKENVIWKFRFKLRLLYLLMLLVRTLNLEDVKVCILLLIDICKYDKSLILILPIALFVRILRIPIGASLRVGRVLKQHFTKI